MRTHLPATPRAPGPRIGAEAEKPRRACPDCGAVPRRLGLDAFPAHAHAEIRAAARDGATFYGCQACGKRWVVMRAKVEKSAEGGFDIVEKHPNPIIDGAARRARFDIRVIGGECFTRWQRLHICHLSDRRRTS